MSPQQAEPEYTHRILRLLSIPIGNPTTMRLTDEDRAEIQAAQQVMGVENLWRFAEGVRDMPPEYQRHCLRPWLARVALEITEPLKLAQIIKLAHGVWGLAERHLKEQIDRFATAEGLDHLLQDFVLWSEPRVTAYVESQWDDEDGELQGQVMAVAGALVAAGDARILTYGQERVLCTLQAMRVPNAAQHLEDTVKTAQAAHVLAGHQGITLRLQDPEVAAEPVVGYELLETLVAQLKRFVVMSVEAVHFTALWILLTYLFEEFDVSPYATYSSPQERCGKTRVMTLITTFARRSLLISNATPASVFRLLETHRPTLLFDEFDSFGQLDLELRNILNAGHTRDSAYVLRCDGEENAVRQFHTYGPKAIALIGRVARTLRDRSIIVPMKRRDPTRESCERLTRKRFRELKDLAETWRGQALRWAGDHLEALHALEEPDVPTELNDRAYDNWTPLMSIAQVVGGDWPVRAQKAALTLSGVNQPDDQQPDTLLLSDLRDIWVTSPSPGIPTADLLKALHSREDRPWREYGRDGHPLTGRGLAKLLERYGVRSKQVHPQNLKGYLEEDLQDSWGRYLPAIHPNVANRGNENRDLGSASHPNVAVPRSDTNSEVSARNIEQCSLRSDPHPLGTVPNETSTNGDQPRSTGAKAEAPGYDGTDSWTG